MRVKGLIYCRLGRGLSIVIPGLHRAIIVRNIDVAGVEVLEAGLGATTMIPFVAFELVLLGVAL